MKECNKQYIINTLRFMETLRLGFLRGVFLANHLVSRPNDNLIKRQNTYQRKLTIRKRDLNKQQHNKKHAKICYSQTWFSRLLRHLVRKRSGFILTTPESAQG